MPIANELAEALAKGALKKVGKSTLKGAVSSAAKPLKGTLYKGKAIKTIVKGKGSWRYIVTEDGAEELVDKEVINSLARAAGTTKKVAEFAIKKKAPKLTQAYKSLEMRQLKAQPKKNQKIVLDYYKKYKSNLEASGAQVPATSLVEQNKKVFTMPKEYADLLEKENILKKLKDL